MTEKMSRKEVNILAVANPRTKNKNQII